MCAVVKVLKHNGSTTLTKETSLPERSLHVSMKKKFHISHEIRGRIKVLFIETDIQTGLNVKNLVWL